MSRLLDARLLLSQHRLKHVGVTLLLTTLLAAVRWAAAGWFPAGADGWFMQNLIETNPLPVYYRSILTVWIHKTIYSVGHPFGLNGWDAMIISSALAGSIALQVLWAFRTSMGFLAVNVLGGSFLVFVGHAENYAWVNLFLLLSWLSIYRWLEYDRALWPAMVFYGLAVLSHMLAVFYAPAYVYLLYKQRRFHWLEVLLPVIALTLLLNLLSLFFQLLGSDNGLNRLVPLFETWATNHHFTFFSWEHLKMLGYFHHRAAWLGVPIELPLLLFLRKRIDTMFLRFMLISVICGLVWTTVWHPDWGSHDWDLFSQFGIPLHLLLGVLIFGHERASK